MGFKKVINILVIKFYSIFRESITHFVVNGLMNYGNSDLHLLNNDFKLLERKIAFTYIAQLTRDFEGDYLEFGVHTGASFILAYRCISEITHDKKCRFFGFDSFEGFPEIICESDKVEGWKEGDFRCDYSSVKKILSTIIRDNEFRLIKGFYDTTLNDSLRKELNIKKAKIIMIDCDLYDSTKKALFWVKPYLDYGSILIFDDYYMIFTRGDPKIGGAAKAFEEFLEDTNFKAHFYCNYGPTGKIFILHEK